MITQRRQASTAGILIVSLIAPAAALLGGYVLNDERIADYWAMAEVSSGDVDANLVEAIDYDFGLKARRGIFRTIPDLDRDRDFSVSSATAPTDTQIGFGSTPRVRIGNPNQTIRGRHRYVLRYTLDTLVEGDQFSWNAVGTEWEVGISNAEIHVVSNNDLLEPRCDIGRRRSFGGCTVEEVAPGHLRVVSSALDDGVGITISATIGDLLTQPPTRPQAPAIQALDSGTSVLIPMLVALLSTLAATPIVGRIVRRRGREQILDTTASTLGFIDDLDSFESYRLADEHEMARLVYPSLDPPRGISAPQGGILMAEQVRPEHKVAWLVEAATLGEVDLEELDHNEVLLRRGSAAPRPTSANRIESIFRSKEEINLKKYDSGFATSWKGLETDLSDWKDRSGYWDSAGEEQRVQAVLVGVLSVGLGALAVAILSGLALRWSVFVLVLLVVAGLVVGSGLTMALRSWELRVRTPEGTSKWLEVEALRRFISELEPESALNMIEPDRFAGYTPWAIAFGLEDKWQDIVGRMKSDPRFQHVPAHHFYIANIGPAVSRTTQSASTAPSSSGGGGFSGGVGGGGGGGGGGSW